MVGRQTRGLAMSRTKFGWIGTVSAAARVSGLAPCMAAAAAAADDNTVQEVVVTGIRESLERAVSIKKNADDQVDVISAEDIGKLPDKNVADALQRLPGVNTTSAASGEGGFDENDRISIRGTSPSLTQVTVDGHSVSTGDWFILDQFSTVGRSISFTLLPAEIVSSVQVYKTQDAGLLEGGTAGSVDILTRNPLDFKKPITFEASVEGAYNSNSGKTKPQINGLIGWISDDGKFGALIQGFSEDRSVERFGQETLGYTTISATSATGKAVPALVGVSAPTLIGSTLFQQERKREGANIALQWRPSDKAEFKLSGFYSHLDATNNNDNYMYWGSNEINNNAPTSYTVQNNTLVAAAFPVNGPAGTPVNGLVVDNITRPKASGESYYVNLDGKFQINDQLGVKTQLGFTRGEGYTPTEPAYEVDGGAGISYARSGNGWAVTPTNQNPQSAAGLANDWAWNETFSSIDKETYFKIDGDYQVNNGPFKDVLFGAHVSAHDRNVQGWDRGCSLGANGQCWGSPPQPYSATNPTSYPSGFSASTLGVPGLLIPIGGNVGAIDSILNNISDGVHGPISSIKQPVNYYWQGSFRVKEDDYAAYALAKVGGEGWRGNFGLRLVDTKENAYVNVSDPAGTHAGDITTSAYGDYYVDHVSHDYVDVLPSVNLTFDVKPDVFLRISAGETMSRPDYSALGGTVSLTDTNLTGSGGNPNLKPIKAAVYDTALEWYYARGSIAAVSVFYNDFSNYVSYGTANEVYFSQFYKSFQTYSVSSPINSSGSLSGAEFQVQQSLPDHFGFQANFTYVDSQDNGGGPLVGTSRLTFNTVAYYDDGRLSARLAYTYRSHFLVGLDRSTAENQDDFGQLDASVNYNVNKYVTFTLQATNITDELLKYYAANKTQPRAVYDNGSQVFAGFRVKY